MPVDHKQQLQNFINGLVAKGIPADQVQAISATLLANDNVVEYFSGGVSAQNLLDQKLNGVRQLEDTLKQNQAQWNAYLAQANQTLSQAERERLAAVQTAAAADTAIKAIASQYNIPESEIQSIYNSQQYRTQPSQQQQQQQQLQAPTFQQQQQSSQQQQQQNGQLTPDEFRSTLGSLVTDILKKDSINARHFELTGKPWNPMKATDYIQQQAQLGRTVELEEAWRVTEGIDALELTAATNAKAAERLQIEKEIREKIASETNQLPTDAHPNFGEARISAIFNNDHPPADGTDGQQQQQNKEQSGHNARTQAATAALQRLRTSRALGQPSPYESSTT